MREKTTAATKQPIEQLREYSDNRGLTLVVDRDQGVIHNVKILGRESRNGREYPDATMARALPLYEGAKVNINHGLGSEPRNYEHRIGQLKNVHAAHDGLYADLHFNPKHALAEQLMWDAEHSPENVGLSHNVVARTARRGSKVVVEEIDRVNSVDLVADPATTKGLFENQQSEDDMTANDDSLVVSQLQQQLQEATDALKKSDDALKEATEKLATMEAEKALLAKRQAIAEELQEVGIDRNNQAICTESVMQQLESLDDAVARKPLIDLMAMATKTSQRPIAGFAPLASVQESADARDFGSLNRFLK